MLTAAVIDPIIFSFGFLTIRWYGVIFVTAVMSAIWMARIGARHRGLDPDFVLDVGMFIVPSGIIGARLYEVFLLQWPYYRANPGEIFALWEGGLAIHGGVLGALLVGGLYIVYRRQSFWLWADMIAPGLILAQGIGRWGNFFNQEAYGSPAPAWLVEKMPGWLREGMTIGGTVMHPTFLYESLWNVLSFVALFLVQRRKPQAGVVFSLYLIAYNTGRFFLESIREDSSFIFGDIRVAQLVSAIQVVVGLGLLTFFLMRGRRRTQTEA